MPKVLFNHYIKNLKSGKTEIVLRVELNTDNPNL
jgi:hypothetical protein